MKNFKLIIAIVSTIAIVFSSCAIGPKKVGPPKKSSVAPGTEVPFSKVMTPGFAEEYIGADIVTKADFFASGMGAWTMDISKDYMVFQALPPGGQGKADPLSGQAKGKFVLIPKTAGEVIFEVKPGDPIILRGGTEVIKGMGLHQVKFIATSVKKAE